MALNSAQTAQFIARWKNSQLNEKQGAQQHFSDLCHLVGHPTPAEYDTTGQVFTFERLVKMPDKRGKKAHGWADVYFQEHFAWEYKTPGHNLDKAYEQLKLYKDELDNPPLLVVSDFTSFRIHTNFNNAPRQVIPFQIEDLAQPVPFANLRNLFWNTEALRPAKTIEKITLETAGKLAEIAHSAIGRNTIYAQQPVLPTENIESEVARYLDRIVFCLFAEDVGLLPNQIFSKMVEMHGHKSAQFANLTDNLFRQMSVGGFFGIDRIPHFNGALFADEPVIELSPREIQAVKEAADLDWKDVDTSIFGTLFEHGLKDGERALLGAHYTSRGDIETLIEPVILAPLRREWDAARAELETIDAEIENGERDADVGRTEQRERLETWLLRLQGVRVLDPACGSGNFLSVALGELLDLEKRALTWAVDAGLQSGDGRSFVSRVRPAAMLGIETNAYAQDLARTSIQITYLQWLHANGYGQPAEPILRHTDNITHGDALFDVATGRETSWPAAEFIVGNPPFLGGSKLWRELGRPYQLQLWRVFAGRVPGAADLCCYWFDKAARHIENGGAKRARLVATQAIRGGANRSALETVKAKGDIFFAIADKNWALAGAAVHISMVAFDDGSQTQRVLDGESVEKIYANLTGKLDLTTARGLAENRDICFIGTKKAGDFNLPEKEALTWLQMPNAHGKPNSDLLRPWGNGKGITQSHDKQWIIDTGVDLMLSDFENYEQVHFIIDARVRPVRAKNNRPLYRDKWWLHAETRPGMRRALSDLPRYIATVSHSKHLIFSWVSSEILCDGGVFVFARDGDFCFGVLHSKIHELWALRQGTQLEDRPRYTPSTCFDTFPFPRPTAAQEQTVAECAAKLNQLRENWLNPPEWMKAETLEFRASAGGPWERHIVPDSVGADGIGLARWTRLVAANPKRPVQDFRFDPKLNQFRNFAVTTEDALAHRTLTNLYNHAPAWLQSAHRKLDEAVFAAYNWPADLGDDEILERLLSLNLERAESENTV